MTMNYSKNLTTAFSMDTIRLEFSREAAGLVKRGVDGPAVSLFDSIPVSRRLATISWERWVDPDRRLYKDVCII